MTSKKLKLIPYLRPSAKGQFKVDQKPRYPSRNIEENIGRTLQGLDLRGIISDLITLKKATE